MSIRSRIIAILLPALLVYPGLANELQSRLQKPNDALPNIVLMMADDMGMGDTSAYQDYTGNDDNEQVDTPNMEKLARLGVRFTDAHTPSSRCTLTRYSLLTGRYSWRNRMKHWVLFGVQGDPMIEADRPTLASMLASVGYRTGLVGKWHVGLRYRQSDGSPAAGWDDADLLQPMYTTPLDHGFHFARFTSRSHGTSGPDAGKAAQKQSGPNQKVGPGHIHGRNIVAATRNGKQLAKDGPDAYVLSELGSRHSDHAIQFMTDHVTSQATASSPFFLYYPSNSNHSPYTPDVKVGDQAVAGAARTKSGAAMDRRHDFILENDVALGRLMDWLEHTSDPRSPGNNLLANTLIIFTSDNGAEKNTNVATGPFRSNKGSVYEGGHRVPLLSARSAGGIGDANASTSGQSNSTLIGLQDIYATLAEMVDLDLPQLASGEKGAEDSFSILPALRGQTLSHRPPMFFNDHKEAKRDHAACAFRMDSPTVQGQRYPGQWKLFFNAQLLRLGKPKVTELYNLAEDSQEQKDLIHRPELQKLVSFLTEEATLHRNVGSHRLANRAKGETIQFSLRSQQLTDRRDSPGATAEVTSGDTQLTMSLQAHAPDDAHPLELAMDSDGLAIRGRGSPDLVDEGEALWISFSEDVIIESLEIVAGDGSCGGYYQVAEGAPLAIYCTDADNDAQNQSGLLSDLGVLKHGSQLQLNSAPHYGVEPPGAWRLASVRVRLLKDE